MTPLLSPTQEQARDRLLARWPQDHLFVLHGDAGTGKSTILRDLHHRLGGALLSIRDLVDVMPGRHPLTLEEAFTQRLRDALTQYPHVLLDDLHLLTNVFGGCSKYPRIGWFDAHLEALRDQLARTDHKLMIATDDAWRPVFTNWAHAVKIPDFQAADYAFFGRTFLGEGPAARLDFAQVHRFAPYLDAHQWRQVCGEVKENGALDTERFIAHLRSRSLVSNVDLGEVESVALSDLQGVDDVVRSLETHIVLPLENDALAQRYGLKPKRGVLLLGPPGTGKTTVGRALAHRLQGKFFLIDGTFISGTGSFYHNVQYTFERAKQNAPAVIFVDDSDVIFQGKRDTGLYRYLLTMLDGLESARSGRVCVMLTAMDVHHLPPALLRSGRIELWLEMHLPDESARARILRHHIGEWPAEHGRLDIARLAAVTADFTGADLKRLIEDGKNLLAYDLALAQPMRPVTEYFLDALATLRSNRRRYAEAEAHAPPRRAARPAVDGQGAGS